VLSLGVLPAGAQTSNWEGADFTNAVVDRVSFDGSSMKVGCVSNGIEWVAATWFGQVGGFESGERDI